MLDQRFITGPFRITATSIDREAVTERLDRSGPRSPALFAARGNEAAICESINPAVARHGVADAERRFGIEGRDQGESPADDRIANLRRVDCCSRLFATTPSDVPPGPDERLPMGDFTTSFRGGYRVNAKERGAGEFLNDVRALSRARARNLR
jgi:hypothetical protein